jgi:hypothetical protein
MKKLMLTRKDLSYFAQKLPLDKIRYYHIAKSLEPFKRARFVKIVDEDGKEKILKNQ